jgi:demethylmenaquinone methyltransferase/2-methoxy-6-polyprenyl-1,4-benzoquinol methylase
MPDLHRLYFNALAEKWSMPPSVAEQLQCHLLDFAPEPGARILDVGAGTGIVTGLLTSSGFPDLFVVPIDISERMLQQGKKNLAEGYRMATCGNVYALPFPNGLFDAAICFSAFPHFEPLPAIRELVRTLRAKGRLLILHTQCSRKLNQFHSSLSGPVSGDRLMKADELATLVALHGLEMVKKIEHPELYWLEARKL